MLAFPAIFGAFVQPHLENLDVSLVQAGYRFFHQISGYRDLFGRERLAPLPTLPAAQAERGASGLHEQGGSHEDSRTSHGRRRLFFLEAKRRKPVPRVPQGSRLADMAGA